jgi:RHS repeat-associated protein
MEKDDEIKGSGNSYDFGARMYDSRLGRWLSVDPLSYRQPHQSPYKSNGNNPIIYNDPDGNQEIIRITIKNSVTGKSTTFLSFPKSGKDKVAAGDFYTDGSGWDSGSTVQNFYDYVKDYTLSYNPNDGTINIAYDGLTLVKENGVQAKDYIWGKIHKSGTIVSLGIADKANDRTIPGGMFLTSKDGGADPTKYKSKNAVGETLSDDLIALIGGMKGNPNSDKYEQYKDFFEGVTKLKDLLDKRGEVRGATTSSDEISTKDKPLSNKTVWETNEDGRYQGTTERATPAEMQRGDTLGGKPSYDSHPEKKKSSGSTRSKF